MAKLSKGLEEDRTTGFSPEELREIYEEEDKRELESALAMKDAMQGTPEDEIAAGVKAQTKKKKKKKKPNDVRFKETKPGVFTIVPFYNPNKNKKAGGGEVYRGRKYASGGRVAKYNG